MDSTLALIGNDKIATNYHVIKEGEEFEITMASTQKILRTSQIIMTDETHDVAIIQLFHESPVILGFSQTEPKVGDDVIVAGSPSGLEGTVSKGIVSSYRRDGQNDIEWIQIDAPISPGSSGGPVLNKDGKLIGISMGGMDKGDLNFVVPVKYILRLIE